MRVFRTVTVTLFLLVAGIYAGFYFLNLNSQDDTIPQIIFDNDILQVSVDASEDDLLRDVRAFDEKDGDLSHLVMVEKISNFIEKGISDITYAVVDTDRHTVKSTRRLHYDDYQSPRFNLSQAMRFEVGSSFNILDSLGAEDLIDGDISGKIKFTGSDLLISTPGVYTMKAQVTNSKGDVSYLRFNVNITPSQRTSLQVNLTDYLVYLKQGDVFDPSEYLLEVMYADELLTDYELDIFSNVNTASPGVYTVNFLVEDSRRYLGETELIVFVET